MEERGEVCLAEEADRLWRSGMDADEISRHMGVDVVWVQTVVGPRDEGPGSDEHTVDRA